MGKGGGTPGISSSVSSGEAKDQTALASLINQQTQESQSLFDLAAPGLSQAENYYQTISSGDPGAIMRADAPVSQQISQATTGAKKNIMDNAPAGGEKNLALEMADVNRGAQIASNASGTVQAANESLGKLGTSGVSQAQSGASIATSGIGTSLSGFQGLGSLQLQSQQLQMEQKGQELGAFGSLAGDATELAFA